MTKHGPSPVVLPASVIEQLRSAESVLAIAPRHDARLVMPRLGEAVEPAHAERVTPWWRGVDVRDAKPAQAIEAQPAPRPRAMPFPLD